MKYGCRAHDYGCFTAQGLAEVLTANGYNAAQLAMPKAIQGIASFTDITPAQLADIRTAFAEADIEISVLSCYQDLSTPTQPPAKSPSPRSAAPCTIRKLSARSMSAAKAPVAI